VRATLGQLVTVADGVLCRRFVRQLQQNSTLA
jgi:hypothetical protein